MYRSRGVHTAPLGIRVRAKIKTKFRLRSSVRVRGKKSYKQVVVFLLMSFILARKHVEIESISQCVHCRSFLSSFSKLYQHVLMSGVIKDW